MFGFPLSPGTLVQKGGREQMLQGPSVQLVPVSSSSLSLPSGCQQHAGPSQMCWYRDDAGGKPAGTIYRTRVGMTMLSLSLLPVLSGWHIAPCGSSSAHSGTPPPAGPTSAYHPPLQRAILRPPSLTSEHTVVCGLSEAQC